MELWHLKLDFKNLGNQLWHLKLDFKNLGNQFAM